MEQNLKYKQDGAYCWTVLLLLEVRILENLLAVIQRNAEESYTNVTSVLQQTQLLKL